MDPTWAVVLSAVFLVALLYSSVGHGGASGYLAVLVLAGFARPEITPLVLILNAAVASLAFVAYFRAGHFVPRLLTPFVVTSLPASVMGGMVPVSGRVYAGILGGALLVAAVRFVALPRPTTASPLAGGPRVWVIGPVAGAVLGFLAGLVGIGGGIFLSPLLLLMRWADAKQTGAVSSAFIVINSVGGFVAHLARGAGVDWALAGPLLAVVLLGGSLGSRWGATRLSLTVLQRLLGVVLAIAGAKLLAGAG